MSVRMIEILSYYLEKMTDEEIDEVVNMVDNEINRRANK